MERKKENKTSPVFFGAVVGIMVIFYAVQLVFPSSFGGTWDKLTEHAEEITVTVTSNGDYDNASGTYYTESTEAILEFGCWADEISMRSRSLANRLTAEKPMEYLFSIKTLDGRYIDLIIDDKGYIQTGTEVYMVTGDKEVFLSELNQQLMLWDSDMHFQ